MHLVPLSQLEMEYRKPYLALQAVDSLDRELRENSAYLKTMQPKVPIYFWGHSFNECNKNSLFPKLNTYIMHCLGYDLWTCWVYSALAMLQLRNERSARIVFNLNDSEYTLSWVEFQVDDVRYVVDPFLLSQGHIPQAYEYFRKIQRNLAAESNTFVIDYDEFWNLPITQKAYQLLRNQHTSQIWYELDCEFWFDPEISIKIDEVMSLRLTNPKMRPKYVISEEEGPDVLIAQSVIDICNQPNYNDDNIIGFVKLKESIKGLFDLLDGLYGPSENNDNPDQPNPSHQ